MNTKDLLKRILPDGLTKTAGEPELTPRKSEVRTKDFGTPSRRVSPDAKTKAEPGYGKRGPDLVEPSRKARLKEIFRRPRVY